MKPSQNNYVLDVGTQDQERLAILDEVIGKTSRQLLLQAGLSSGKTVLEVGCGTGNMTRFIAEQVGAHGQVTAVDVSGEQIDIAKKNVSELKQITFVQASIFDLPVKPQFDFVYCRFIIMHLPNPANTIKHLLSFLKPGGKIICEEATNRVTCCYPQNIFYQQSRDLLLMLGDKKGLDFNVGEKLYSIFYDLKLTDITAHFIQPVLHSERQKRLISLLASSLKQQFLSNNLISETEIDKLIKELNSFIQDDHYFVSFSRTTQICGTKIEC
jgi:ubiquinone/menaquinone biosynthesis C-methylase UbiE